MCLVQARDRQTTEDAMTLVPPSAAPGLPGKSAAKADVPAARRTGQKKRTRDEVEVEEDEVEVEEEEEERIRHNTNLLRVLARKELVDLARLHGVLPIKYNAFIVESLACVLDIRAPHVHGKVAF